MSLTYEQQLLLLLKPDVDPKVKVQAIETVLGLTATDDGLQILTKDCKFLKCLAALLNSDSEIIMNQVLKCFVNLTSVESVITELRQLDEELDFVAKLLSLLTYETSRSFTPMVAMILSNITRQAFMSELVLSKLTDVGGMVKLMILLRKGIPESSYHYIASIIANLTQIANGRRLLMDDKEEFKNILPFTLYMDSEVRRLGIVGTLRNCCFDTEYHSLLLDEKMNLLSYLLLPLAGPEEFDEEDNEKLPLDLQYLDNNKQRDRNPEIRRLLIEALTQLCAKPEGRRMLRDKNVYVIMRELHNWEKKADVIVVCLNLIDILIGDEPQPGMENLKEIDIPTEMVEKFEKMDEELLQINS